MRGGEESERKGVTKNQISKEKIHFSSSVSASKFQTLSSISKANFDPDKFSESNS